MKYVFLIRNMRTQGKRWVMFASETKEEAIASCDELVKDVEYIEGIFVETDEM